MQKQILEFVHNGIVMVFCATEAGTLRLLHFGPAEFDGGIIPADTLNAFPALELQATGRNPHAHHSFRHVGSSPADRLLYVEHREEENAAGHKLVFVQADDSVRVETHWQFYGQTPVVQCWTEVENKGSAPLGLEYVTSFACNAVCRGLGLPAADWPTSLRLGIGRNTWFSECDWQEMSLPEFGLKKNPGFQRVTQQGNGTWPTAESLAMGYLRSSQTSMVLGWQIEAAGAWHWEIGGAANDEVYLRLSGPTEAENHWWHALAPGERFTSVPVAVAAVQGGVDELFAALTEYRRAMRRPNRDNNEMPVIFNDYMNCLMADPTTAKLLPLIDAAAEVGCEYFCIDAGWYADGYWWDEVGEWLPTRTRFPNGIQEPIQYIRDKGMIPGLWVEIEVMGIKCPLADKLPDSWFFMRHGQRVIDHGRYQLDFRNPDVRRYADSVIDRMVQEYGVGYIKIDYNINIGIGTEHEADSAGDGLLEHTRAYLAWLDAVLERYPELIIENCASGGMRMTYALLQRLSIQSVSDQMDYLKFAQIAAACPTAVAPEQAAIWSYPLRQGNREEVVFNMVNAMLMRIHQSGHLAELAPERRALVEEGIQVYKEIRGALRDATPFWPLGLPAAEDDWVALGMRTSRNSAFLAVWRVWNSERSTCELPLPRDFDGKVKVVQIYPQTPAAEVSWDAGRGALSVTLPEIGTARLFRID